VSWRNHAIGAIALLVVGAVALTGVLLTTRGSVRDHLRDRYTLVRSTDGGRSIEYASDDRPSAVAAAIAGKWKPAERLADPSGYFLRYRNDIVAITAAAGGGSRIFVDEERRGYTRWYPYVGGYWGTYSGPGEGFRGGGPGAGK
jgi:hypothetical protein